MAILDPLELEIWKQAQAGQNPDPSQLYAQPAAPDPSLGLPPEAVAGPEMGAGGTSSMGASGVGNVPAPQQMGGAGGTIGVSGGGMEGAPGLPDPAAGGARMEQVQTPVAPAVDEAMARSAAAPAPAAPVARQGVGGGAAPKSGVPQWLQQAAAEEGFAPEPPERDPHLPGVPETPGEQRARQEIQGEIYGGVEDQYEAEKYAREAQLRSAQAAEDARQRVDLENRQRMQARRQRMAERETKFREMADAAAAEPIDSNRLWNNMGTGEKIMQRIAMFLGAIGTAQGGPNFVMQKMEADINRDMEAQKANKQSKYRRLDDEKTLHDMASDRFEDEETQDAAARESAYRKIAQQVEFFGQHVKEPARREAVEGLKREVDAKIVNAEQQRRQANEIYVMQLEAARAKAAAGANRRPDDKLFIPGFGYARDPKSVEGARGLAIASRELTSALDEMEQLRKKGARSGAFGVGSTEYQQAQTLRGKIVANYARVLASGFNPSQQVEEKAEKLVPDPSSWTEAVGGYEGKAKALRQTAQQATEAGMEQYIKHRTPAGWKPESER